MLQTLRNAWKIPDLRKKMLYTILMLVIFRLGSFIPVPGIDAEMIKQLMGGFDQGIQGLINNFSGGALERASIFAMSITPYINASIILQLLTVAIPALEKLAKEGEEGRKKNCFLYKICNGYSGVHPGNRPVLQPQVSNDRRQRCVCLLCCNVHIYGRHGIFDVAG